MVSVVSLAAAAVGPAAVMAEGVGEPTASCHRAAQAAEKRHGIPSGLLQAIGQVESGRREAEDALPAPWPWTISAEGRGRFFPSQAEAVAEVAALRSRGVASIDVGCMQVNLLYHPAAFEDLAVAFAPERNADYAARFLKSLYAEAGDWREAVGRYHSATPSRKQAYADKVMAAWQPEFAPLAPRPTAGAGLSPAAYRAVKVAQYLARRSARSGVD